MAANKSELAAILAAKANISAAEANEVLTELPAALGEWLKAHGADGPGVFNGEIDGNVTVGLTRTAAPSPRWVLKLEPMQAFLDDFGDAGARFGLTVVND